jgi:hypothetical protein
MSPSEALRIGFFHPEDPAVKWRAARYKLAVFRLSVGQFERDYTDCYTLLAFWPPLHRNLSIEVEGLIDVH